jgi:hypothetical protein
MIALPCLLQKENRIMAYTDTDFKTKKSLKEAVAEGKEIRVYNPSGMFPVPTDGNVTLEGPHYPKPHTWYAQATLKDGKVVKVK